MSSPPAVRPPDGAAARAQTELLPAAARLNKLAVVKELLNRGGDANSKDRRGWASLHWAARHNAVEIAELLIANDADVNAKRWDGMTVLQSGRGRLRQLIRQAADIEGAFDVNSMDDARPLHSAAEHNAREAAALLIANNAKLNARDADGWTPLHWAAQHNAAAVVKLLIDNNADVDAKRWGGLAVLYADLYADLGWKPPKVEGMFWRDKVRELRIMFNRKLMRWEETLADESTPLYAALTNNALEAAKLLIAGGADVDGRDNRRDGVGGRTLLHWAADSGAAEHVRLLLDGGAKVNTRDKSSWPSPQVLIRPRSLYERHMLHDKVGLEVCWEPPVGKAEAKARDESGWTPLHSAVGRGAAEIVRLLLEAKADVNAKVKYGVTPLHLAAVRGKAEIVELLLNLRAETDVNARNEEGRTSLHVAAEHGKAEVVRLLLTLRAETDVNARGEKGRAPLYVAVEQGAAERLLLTRAETDVNARGEKGRAPLYVAVEQGEAEIVRLLLRAETDDPARGERMLTRGKRVKERPGASVCGGGAGRGGSRPAAVDPARGDGC